jgi:hypothetical protein
MEYQDLFELLEAVRQYESRPKESLILLNSVDGSRVGYVTAHTEHPSLEWSISRRSAKTSALARGTREALRIRELLGTSLGRKQILHELREGSLEYGISRGPWEPVDVAPGPAAGPHQCLIPGL